MSSKTTSWTRLEPKHRSLDVRSSLARPVADPAWLLLRQWQVGEFEASDGGSPLLIELDTTTSMLNRFHAGEYSGTQGVSYSPDLLPIDALVEHEDVEFNEGELSVKLMAFAGEQFFEDLMVRLGANVLIREAWRGHYQGFGFEFDEQNLPNRENQRQAAIFSQLIDGRKLYAQINDEFAAFSGSLGANSPLLLGGQNYNEVNATATWWMQWVETLIVTARTPSSWVDNELMYKFAVATKNAQGVETVLDGYSRGDKLDWYSFDQRTDGASLGAVIDSTTQTAKRILSPIRFVGSSGGRFWTMDDGQSALVQSEATTMHLAQSLWLEFMVTYSDSWWLAPLTLPVGSINTITDARLVTTFDQGLSLPVLTHESDHFSLFTLQTGTFTPTLFLPSVSDKKQLAESVESMRLVRDEMQNVAWAIEEIVIGGAGQPERRHETWRGVEQTSDFPNELLYKLASPMPDFWYPMIPQAELDLGGLMMSLTLKRGLLLTDDEVQSPKGVLAKELELPDYEVPRRGRRIVRRDVVSRWSNGDVLLWRGRSNQHVEVDNDSGLAFDQLLFDPAQTATPPSGGAFSAKDNYAWSLFDVMSHIDGASSYAPVGPVGTVVGDVEVVSPSMVKDADHSLDTGSGGYVSYDQIDYLHQTGIFTVMAILSIDSVMQTSMLWGTTTSFNQAGVSLRFDASSMTLQFSYSTGAGLFSTNVPVNPFAHRGPVVITTVSDGVDVRFYLFDELVHTIAFNPAWLSDEEGGVFCFGTSNVSSSEQWSGALGAVGVLPAVLNAEQVALLVRQVRLEPSLFESPLLWIDGKDPLSMFTSTHQEVLAGQEILEVESKGSLLADMTRSSAGSVVWQPNQGIVFDGAHEGFEVQLDHQLDECAFVFSFKQDVVGEATLFASSVGGASARDNIEIGIDDDSSAVVIYERGRIHKIELGTLNATQAPVACTIRFDKYGRIECWNMASIKPAFIFSAYAPSYQGTWSTSRGQLRLRQKDNAVWGDFAGVGVIEGLVDPQTGVLTGTYTNNGVEGQLEWTIDGDDFTGVWADGQAPMTNNWIGYRDSLDEPTLQQWDALTIVRQPSFEGTWNSSFAQLRLKQKDDVVWGDYGTVGTIEGRVDAQTGVLDGIFTNGSNQGRIRFELVSPTHFEGLWAWGTAEPINNWDGDQTSSNTPTLTKWPSGAPSFEGTWSSSFGPLRLKQAGTRVWGDYSSVGIIEGTMDLTTGVLDGIFTNGASQGRIEFTHTGTTFDGLWAYGTAQPTNNWDGTLTNSVEPTLAQWPAYGFEFVETSFEGTWSSTRGEMRLKQAGTRVWGEFGTSGTLEGNVDRQSNTLFASYDNGQGETGSLVFALTSQHIEGVYGVGSNQPGINWDGDQINNSAFFNTLSTNKQLFVLSDIELMSSFIGEMYDLYVVDEFHFQGE